MWGVRLFCYILTQNQQLWAHHEETPNSAKLKSISQNTQWDTQKITHRKTQKLSGYKGFPGLDLGMERRLEMEWAESAVLLGVAAAALLERWLVHRRKAHRGMVSVRRKPPNTGYGRRGQRVQEAPQDWLWKGG